MVRYETVVEDGTVYVATDGDRLAIGALETIVELVGGRAWTVSYSDREKQAHPELSTADEGLTVDVVDTINAMTFGEAFVETLAAQPGAAAGDAGTAEGDAGMPHRDEDDADADTAEDAANRTDSDANTADGVSPRLGLFVGRLLENLAYGLR